MEGLNWGGILFFVMPISLTLIGFILVVIAEIVVQAIVTINKIGRKRFWVKK